MCVQVSVLCALEVLAIFGHYFIMQILKIRWHTFSSRVQNLAPNGPVVASCQQQFFLKGQRALEEMHSTRARRKRPIGHLSSSLRKFLWTTFQVSVCFPFTDHICLTFISLCSLQNDTPRKYIHFQKKS